MLPSFRPRAEEPMLTKDSAIALRAGGVSK